MEPTNPIVVSCKLRVLAASAAFATVLFGCACSTPDKAAKERASWDSAARMTADAWLSGSVSTRFAVDTLETAARETKSSRYEPLKTAIQRHDSSRVRLMIRP